MADEHGEVVQVLEEIDLTVDLDVDFSGKTSFDVVSATERKPSSYWFWIILYEFGFKVNMTQKLLGSTRPVIYSEVDTGIRTNDITRK